MGGPGRDLEAVPKNLASPPEGVADRAAGSASSLESFCVQPGPGPAREGQCPALHTGACAHLRAAAPGHSEAKLFYLTIAAPLPLVVYALDLAPRLTRAVITCFPGQTVPLRLSVSITPAPSAGAASARNGAARARARRGRAANLLTPVSSLNFHELETSFWNIIHIQRNEISSNFDCRSSKTWLEYDKEVSPLTLYLR